MAEMSGLKLENNSGEVVPVGYRPLELSSHLFFFFYLTDDRRLILFGGAYESI